MFRPWLSIVGVKYEVNVDIKFNNYVIQMR